MKRRDQGHLHPKLDVPRLTCPGRESNPNTLEESHSNSLLICYSEPVQYLYFHLRPPRKTPSLQEKPKTFRLLAANIKFLIFQFRS